MVIGLGIASLLIAPLAYTDPTLASFRYSLAPFRLSIPLLSGTYPCVHENPSVSDRCYNFAAILSSEAAFSSCPSAR